MRTLWSFWRGLCSQEGWAGPLGWSGSCAAGLRTHILPFVGTAVGQGLYALAGAGTALALLVLLGLNRLERRIPAHSYHTVAVSVQGTEVQRAEEACRGLFSQARQRVLAVDVRLDREEDRACPTFYVRSTGEVKATQLAEGLLSLPGVSEVRWR